MKKETQKSFGNFVRVSQTFDVETVGNGSTDTWTLEPARVTVAGMCDTVEAMTELAANLTLALEFAATLPTN